MNYLTSEFVAALVKISLNIFKFDVVSAVNREVSFLNYG